MNTTHVSIGERLLHRIGHREWGLPSLRMPGQIWRTEGESPRMFCMVAKDGEPDTLEIESLPLVTVPAGESQWIPSHWSAAIWEYVQAWPSSGCGYGPWLRITDDERNALIRKEALLLAAPNDIGCQSIAYNIGMLAAYDYERLTEVDERIAKEFAKGAA